MPVANKIQDRDTRAEALLILAESAIRLGKYSEGIRFAVLADSADNGDEGWIEAKSWYLAALGNYHLGDLPVAEKVLQKAKDTSEYGSNNILNALVNGLERHLNWR
jgi:hypothetical protein